MTKQIEATSLNEAFISGKPRFRRECKKTLGIGEEEFNGAVRFKITGLYIGGKRVGRFFQTEKEPKTFIEGQTVRQGNIDVVAKHRDGRTANDAVECEFMLRPCGARRLDAVREWTAARDRLKGFDDASMVDGARHYAQVLRERHTSWTVELEPVPPVLMKYETAPSIDRSGDNHLFVGSGMPF